MRINHFNFKEFHNKILITNDLGRYMFLEKEDFRKLVGKTIDLDSCVGKELINNKMVYQESNLLFSKQNEFLLRESKSQIVTATALHIFVVTTACNLNCKYCQANNGTKVPNCFMTLETAEKAVEIALQSPERNLSFEFQGGEPLMNFSVIKHIVEYSEEHNTNHNIAYSIVSNLTLLTDEILDFFAEHNVSISTSLDGNESLHNYNRPLKSGAGSFEYVAKKINQIKEKVLSVGAIQTTTKASLPYAKEIVDTYVELGFNSIFIRHLTQLGKAQKNWGEIGYSAEQYLDFYRGALDYIIELNKENVEIIEQHAAILLKRMNGTITNYMELRSPCGAGIGQLAYFADGRVFTCDEGRMLAEMGNDAFLLGDVRNDTYCSIINNRVCKAACASSILETIPSCCDCVYQPYCGVCPVVNYSIGDDLMEKEPRSYRCKVYSGMLDYLFKSYLDGDAEIINVLNSWSQ